jgi:rhodanese-related sulfurtransferase
VAEELALLGFHDVHPLLGGFDEWVEKGYPVEKK